MNEALRGTPQQVAALAAQMVRGQGAPMTAENLNRAMIALLQGQETTAFDMNAAIDRLATRTSRPLPMPAPRTPRPNSGEVVGEAIPAEPREEAPEAQVMPQTNEGITQQQMNRAPAMADAVVPELAGGDGAAGDVDMTNAALLAAGAAGAAALSPRVAALLARRNAAQQAPNLGVTLREREAPGRDTPAVEYTTRRLTNDRSNPALTGPQPLPAITGPTSAQLLPPPQPRVRTSETARQHREEVRANTQAARAEAAERDRMLRQLRTQVRAEGIRGTVNVNREAMRRYEALREGGGVAPPTVTGRMQ